MKRRTQFLDSVFAMNKKVNKIKNISMENFKQTFVVSEEFVRQSKISLEPRIFSLLEFESDSFMDVIRTLRSDMQVSTEIVADSLGTLEKNGYDVPNIFYTTGDGNVKSPEYEIFRHWYRYNLLCDYILPQEVILKTGLDARDLIVLGKAMLMRDMMATSISVQDCDAGMVLEDFLALFRIDSRGIGGIVRHVTPEIVYKHLSNVLDKLSFYEEDHDLELEVPEYPINTIEDFACVLGEKKTEEECVCVPCNREEPCATFIEQENVDKFYPFNNGQILEGTGGHCVFAVDEEGKELKVRKKSSAVKYQGIRNDPDLEYYPTPTKIREYKYNFGSVDSVPVSLLKNFTRETRSMFRSVCKNWYAACKSLQETEVPCRDVFSRHIQKNPMTVYMRQQRFYFDEKIVDYIMYYLMRSHGTTFNFCGLLKQYWDIRRDATGFILMLAIEVCSQRDPGYHTRRSLRKLLCLYWCIPRSVRKRIAKDVIYCASPGLDCFEVNVKGEYYIEEGSQMSTRYCRHLAIGSQDVW